MPRLATSATLPAARALAVRRLPVDAITPDLTRRMFALFARYYDATSAERFAADLAAKHTAILLEHGDDLAGFTTLRTDTFDWRGETIGVVYSGDTIVDRRYWGEQALARAWLHETGRIARSMPGRRLFWLLIVKGHRTFRYLPAFARAFVPMPGGSEPAELTALRDALARDRFGAQFDAASGVVRFAASQGQLAESWAEPTRREAALPEVGFFLAANPGFRDGDELVCLAELAPANMRARARRWFDGG